MPDFKGMYYKLFNAQTDAITILQKAQKDTEEMYLTAPDTVLRLHETKPPEEGDGGTDKE